MKYNWKSTGPGGCDSHCIEHPCGPCITGKNKPPESKLFVIKLRHKLGIGAGKTGYHSVYRNRQTADKCLAIRQYHNTRQFDYWLEELEPVNVAETYRKQASVRFQDSQGSILVDERLPNDRTFEQYPVKDILEILVSMGKI